MTVVSLALTPDRQSLCLRFDGRPEQRRPFAQTDAEKLREIVTAYDQATSFDQAARLPTIGRDLANWLDGPGRWLTRLLDDGELEAPLVLEITGPKRPEASDRALLEAPWELLWVDDGFLASDITVGYTPLRRVGVRKAARGTRPGALSVLFMAAAPRGVSELDFEAEEARILAETDELGIDLFVEETGTARELGRRAARLASDAEHALHVVHLTCHGANVPAPTLVLEDQTGAVAETSTAALFEAIGDRGRDLGLLFLSACSTAVGGGFSRDQDSLTLGLVRAGFPAVLGWAASVFDRSATRFAAALYERLGGGGASLESAVAHARRAMLTRAGGADPHWHLARLFLGPSGGGTLAEPAGARRKGLPIHEGFLGDRRSLVAGSDVFVGRRRQLQDCIRTLGRSEHAGLLIHGPGNIGKSSLAARIVDRLSEHETVVMYGGFDGTNLVKAIKDKLGSRVDGWYRRWSSVADDELESALRSLLDTELAERQGNTPLLLVLDDFEQLLEEPPNHARVRALYQTVVAAVLHAFRHANTRSRVLLTSRFKFEIQDAGGHELSTALAVVPVAAFSERETEKRTRREPAPPKGQTDLRFRCAAASRGNPALLALLLKRASADHDGCIRVLGQIENLEHKDSDLDDEEFSRFLQDIAVEDLLKSLGEDLELFERSLLFESPLPLEAGSILRAAGKGCEGDEERLIALGVWEEVRDLADDGVRAFVPNALVRGMALRMEMGVTKRVHADLVVGLTEFLSTRWASITNDTGDSAKTRAGHQLVELATQRGDWATVRLFGRLALAWVNRTMTFAGARDYAKQIIERLDAADVEPGPRLCGDAARIHKTSDEGDFHHRCLARALEAVAMAGEELPAEERAGLHFEMAASLQRRGELTLAEAELKQGRALLVGETFERERAVFDGRLADILQARGDLDEALRIRAEEELPVYERLGDVRSRAMTMGDIADILQARGDLDEALRIRREEELPVYERLGDVRSRAVTMGRVADILQARGDLDEALRIRREEQLPVYERLGDVRSRAVTMGQVADILQARGDLDEALRIRREELPVYERLGDVRSLLVGKTNLAIDLVERGHSQDHSEIASLLAQALRDARALRISEATQIEGIIRQLGGDPDQPPFA